MAVYTDLSDEDVEALLADFDLGAALSLKGIAEGVENTNFLLDTERGRFILTIYEKRVNPDDLPFFMQLMETLADKGIPSPRPMHGKDGQALRRIKNKLSALVTFLDGVSPKKPSANQCRALGEAMAQMHLALADFPLSRPNSLGAASWAKLFEGRHAAAENLKAGDGDRVAADLQFLSANWPAHLPQGIIHADLFPDNALFIGDRLGGIIDFYFACADALAYDLAISLNAWCFEPSGEYNLTKGRAMIAGYESVRPLRADERAALPILARGAAMRFFLTRLVDWDSTPAGALVRPKNPGEYAAKLAFHRAAAGPGDYGA